MYKFSYTCDNEITDEVVSQYNKKNYMSLKDKIVEYQREKSRCALYKRVRSYIHEKELAFCYLTDGQIVTPRTCDDIIDDFERSYPDYETKYPEWSIYESETERESIEGSESDTLT